MDKGKLIKACPICGTKFSRYKHPEVRFCSPRCAKYSRGTPEERFWKNVRRGTQDECWMWTGGKTRRGYGLLWAGCSTKAHRMSWALHNGPVPPRMHVLHRCDNPPCVNPAHLFIGTHADNMADMAKKGRGVIPALRGELSGTSKLTTDRVISIRSTAGRSQQAMAAEHGVSQKTISLIVRRITWTHI